MSSSLLVIEALFSAWRLSNWTRRLEMSSSLVVIEALLDDTSSFKLLLTAFSSWYPSSLGFASFFKNFPFFAASISIQIANRQIKAPFKNIVLLVYWFFVL